MIFGTEGQSAAGTSENDTPSVTTSSSASHFEGKSGSRKAKLRWQAIMMTAPTMSIVAPLPRKSSSAPRKGVSTMARMGKQLKSCAADWASIPSVTSRKLGA